VQPGERVTLITKIAGSLSERNWAEVDLNLVQFGLTTTHAERAEYGVAVQFMRENPRLGNELAARFPSLDERDRADLLARAAARAAPVLAPA
jgi:hypothetical protein